MSVERLREIRAVIERLEKIASTHSPRVFDGDIALFVAAQDLDRHPEVVDAWREYTGGVVTAHHIDDYPLRDGRARTARRDRPTASGIGGPRRTVTHVTPDSGPITTM